MPDIKVGQIWKEVDPRHERFVRIIREAVQFGDEVEIETVVRIDSEGPAPWTRKHGS